MELSPETKFRLAFTSVLGAVAMLGFTPEVNNIENHSALSTPAPIIKWLNGARIEFYKDTITTDLCVGTTHVHELSVVNPDESGRNDYHSSMSVEVDRMCQDGVIDQRDFLAPLKKPVPLPVPGPQTPVNPMI